MKDDNQGTRSPMRYVRYTVFALAGLLVLTLGFAVIPGQPPAQEPPSLTEQARASALDDALALRSAGLDLADAAPAGNPVSGPADRVVTLLTFQARALLPAGSPSPSGPAPSGPATATTAPSAAPDPARTAIDLAKAVAASGSRRLEDAATADGGMARLLAGAGTAQLLAASELAAAAGDPGAVAGAATTPGTASSPVGGAPVGSADAAGSPSPAPGSGRGGTPGRCLAPAPAGGQESATGAAPTEAAPELGAPFAGSADAALSAVLQAGQQALYGYQAAMPRLAPADAGSASDFLEQHRQLVADAETRLRQACVAAAPQAPGYVLDAAFLEDPARGLGALEAAALPAYGDLVALTDGADRAWALAALRQATARTVRWGADPGPVPGIVLDTAALPVLPDGEEAQARQ
ncbi:DUF4439 domain-containing protein [Pseudarthrobacter enclensis]|uniref:DUF4439 domain-containing protein n=1 Tax=Pseudarthrobacter enclensis TaxID=993070 RepID=UPI003EDF8108